MEFLTQNPFIQTWFVGNKYAQAVLIVLAFLIVGKIITFISARYLRKIASRTKTKLDDLIIEKIKPPFSYVMLFVGFKFALKPLGFEEIWFGHLVDTVAILAFMYIIWIIIDIFLEVWSTEFAVRTQSQLDDSLMPLVRNFFKVFVLAIAAIWVLKEWGINIGPFLASLGIAGVVIGFALQDSLKNIFGGVSLVLDGSIKVGDKIKLESGELGEIQEIGIRSTKLQTYDNEVINIPNGQLSNSKIQNYVQPDLSARVTVDFGVEYGSNVEKVKQVVTDTVLKMEEVMEDPEPWIIFYEMGDFALKFKMMFWVPDYNIAYEKQMEATEKIYNALNKAGIGIPFPTSTVYLEKEE